VQEAVDLVILAFELAEKYLNPVMVIGDGMIGQMMEPVEFPEKYEEPPLPEKTWACTGAKNRKPNVINSLYLDPEVLNTHSWNLHKKYEQMKREEVRFADYNISKDNEILMVAYGTMARICQTAIDELKRDNISVGLFRPISLFPYPSEQLRTEAEKKNIKALLTVEMSTAQMYEDVELSIRHCKENVFYGKTGGVVPAPEEIVEQAKKLIEKCKSSPSTGKKKN
jgi:2-oxoglutarate ferredoxin oxidoreductase subunit alpha